MPGTKKDSPAGVTYYPAEGVWRDSGGKLVKESAPVSRPTPAFDAPRDAPSEPNTGPAVKSAPSGS